MEDYFKNGNPDGRSRREIFGEPMRSIPAFREPGRVRYGSDYLHPEGGRQPPPD